MQLRLFPRLQRDDSLHCTDVAAATSTSIRTRTYCEPYKRTCTPLLRLRRRTATHVRKAYHGAPSTHALARASLSLNGSRLTARDCPLPQASVVFQCGGARARATPKQLSRPLEPRTYTPLLRLRRRTATHVRKAYHGAPLTHALARDSLCLNGSRLTARDCPLAQG